MRFLEIGADKDHFHFLVQSVSTCTPTRIITVIKSIAGREIFKKHPEVEKQRWGGEFRSDGYFVNTVSNLADEDTISRYVREQGNEEEYTAIHKSEELALF